jgi:hypothetical protein
MRHASLDSPPAMCERGAVRGGLLVSCVLALAAACLAVACGSLDTPTRPEPTPEPATPPPVVAQPGPTPTPILGLPGPAPTPTPDATPQPSPTPTASPGEGASACGTPLPPPLSDINVKIHIRGNDAWVIDSTPLVGPDAAYCAAIGFTDGRSMCPVRPEGNPQREACELYVTGRAKDTGRPGPTWYFNGSFCSGRGVGCENSPENQYQALVYTGGVVRACGMGDVCGEVTVER